jgi:hypothetical protein
MNAANEVDRVTLSTILMRVMLRRLLLLTVSAFDAESSHCTTWAM